jgi:uncharacterized lipoprotein NlpE involved in copper resistance
VKLKIIFTFLLALVLAIGCTNRNEPEEMDTDAILTSVVGTMAASFFETQTAMVTPETATPTETITPLPTITPFSLDTPLASPTPLFFTAAPLGTITPGTPIATGTFFTATINPSSLASGCNNLAFVRDVNMPSGTVLQKNQEFTKTWKVQNTGTCNWQFQYRLVRVSGDAGGAESDFIRKQVAVWNWTDVSVSGTAPNKPGTYTSQWRMADGAGRVFGATLTLSFVVAQPTATPVPPTNTPETTSYPNP